MNKPANHPSAHRLVVGTVYTVDNFIRVRNTPGIFLKFPVNCRIEKPVFATRELLLPTLTSEGSRVSLDSVSSEECVLEL